MMHLSGPTASMIDFHFRISTWRSMSMLMACFGHGILVTFILHMASEAMNMGSGATAVCCSGGGSVILICCPMIRLPRCHLSKAAPDLSQNGIFCFRLTPWILAMYGSGVHVRCFRRVASCSPVTILMAEVIGSAEIFHDVLCLLDISAWMLPCDGVVQVWHRAFEARKPWF